MILRKLRLVNFRNFSLKEVNFGKKANLIVGKNSKGKTNILEAIYFLINGFGFREQKEEELIRFSQSQMLVVGEFLIGKDLLSFSVSLKADNKKTIKRFHIEKAEKKFFAYIKELIKTVLFSPNQLTLITGSPSLRRDYFDKFISFVDDEYRKKLINYENGIKRRNKVLESNLNFERLKKELSFWDDYLIKQGSYLTQKRAEYTNYLNQNQELAGNFFKIEYKKNEISNESLKKSFEISLDQKKTLVGPQRDDFEIFLISHTDKKSIHRFGSRSEQRLALFWLKMNEIKYLEEKTKKKPIILMDDIFSEFDEENKRIIFPVIENYQSVATSTEVIKNIKEVNYIYL
ncbi:MAG: DNA replication and repair protein RecF [Patescibacteria group bacterium]|nr:DNA replication and repair protein RecF [Patescibacteria group bacterium]